MIGDPVTTGDGVRALVAAELGQAADPRVTRMAAAIAALHPDAARAVLFYGSCLRSTELSGQMLDFYLIVSDYAAAYAKRWLGAANRILPPNVFPFTHDGLAAKYAILSEQDLTALCGPEASTVSVWARFAQPSRLVWVADTVAEARVVDAVARAAPTLFALTLPTLHAPSPDDPLPIWRAAFALTYHAELRAERDDRSGSIVDADPERYRRFGRAVLAEQPSDTLQRSPSERSAAQAQWRQLQRRGKWMTAARLVKASATFAGGIDYLAWKIHRHAGTGIVIRPWQRRFPLIGALTLLPRLLRGGAVR